MQRTVIAVWASRNHGKTTTILEVYRRLLQEASHGSPGHGSKELLAAWLEIDGVKVGFISKGDKPEELKKDFRSLEKARCTVIVCACHTEISLSYQEVVRLASEAEPPFEVVWKEKGWEADHDAGNNRMAEEIIEAVHEAIRNTQRPAA
jgi:hypothetical protein